VELSPSTPQRAVPGTRPATSPPESEVASRKPCGDDRPNDQLFEAIVQVTGSDRHVTGSHIGKVRAKLAAASPPYTSQEVREFSRRLHDFCPWAKQDGRVRPTLGELDKYIGQLRCEPPTGGVGRPGRVDPRPGKYDGFDEPGAGSSPAHPPQAVG
jgi:hypothetical protein